MPTAHLACEVLVAVDRQPRDRALRHSEQPLAREPRAAIAPRVARSQPRRQAEQETYVRIIESLPLYIHRYLYIESRPRVNPSHAPPSLRGSRADNQEARLHKKGTVGVNLSIYLSISLSLYIYIYIHIYIYM